MDKTSRRPAVRRGTRSRGFAGEHPALPEDRSGIVAAPAPEDRAPGSAGRKPWLRPLFAIAAVALALAIVGSVWFFRQPAFPASVAQDFRDYQSQKITLQLETSDVQELEEVMG